MLVRTAPRAATPIVPATILKTVFIAEPMPALAFGNAPIIAFVTGAKM